MNNLQNYFNLYIRPNLEANPFFKYVILVFSFLYSNQFLIC
ncbi:unnamed protein product [Meloidogyne enterolobii]|uniref:Uncharacterized protein n=1 Tax=Meloidogyne enterolobii TaxID=390850 RepID=A0ACB0YK14_MELEN